MGYSYFISRNGHYAVIYKNGAPYMEVFLGDSGCPEREIEEAISEEKARERKIDEEYDNSDY